MKFIPRGVLIQSVIKPKAVKELSGVCYIRIIGKNAQIVTQQGKRTI
jgi:hypothetical protein